MDPSYLNAHLAEFEAIPGSLLLGPDTEAIPVVVRAFTDPQGVRVVIESGTAGVGHQLVVDAEGLKALLEEPQEMPEQSA